MKPMNLTVGQLAGQLSGQVEGDPNTRLVGLAAVEAAGPTDLTFVVDARRAKLLAGSKAAAALVPANVNTDGIAIALIRVADVNVALTSLLGMLARPEDRPAVGTHKTATVAPSAKIGQDVAIGPGAVVEAGGVIGDGAALCANTYVGSDAVIGAGTVLLPGTVVLHDCRIGRNCRIGPGAVIGAMGFGYGFRNGRHELVPHAGNVEIGDDVDIKANACVDRAKFGSTRIGDGCKIDNLCQIAHNVQMGRGCVLAAFVGIAGSAVLKDYVVLAGQVGVRDNITLGSGVRCGGLSAITHDWPDGAKLWGNPAVDAGKRVRIALLSEKLPELFARLRDVEKKVQALESPKDH